MLITYCCWCFTEWINRSWGWCSEWVDQVLVTCCCWLSVLLSVNLWYKVQAFGSSVLLLIVGVLIFCFGSNVLLVTNKTKNSRWCCVCLCVCVCVCLFVCVCVCVIMKVVFPNHSTPVLHSIMSCTHSCGSPGLWFWYKYTSGHRQD